MYLHTYSELYQKKHGCIDTLQNILLFLSKWVEWKYVVMYTFFKMCTTRHMEYGVHFLVLQPSFFLLTLLLDNTHQMIRPEGDYWPGLIKEEEKIVTVSVFYLESTDKPVKSVFFCTPFLPIVIFFK